MNALFCLSIIATAITASLSQVRDPCRTCQILLNIARHHFNNTVNDQLALQVQLLIECERLGQFDGPAAATDCARIVNMNMDTIYNDLHTNKSSLQTCQDINECPMPTTTQGLQTILPQKKRPQRPRGPMSPQQVYNSRRH